MLRLKLLLLAVSIGIVGGPSKPTYAQQPSSTDASASFPCAVFAGDGWWARGNFTRAGLQIAVGKSETAGARTMPIDFVAGGCKLVFSADGQYLAAAAVSHGGAHEHLHIGVFQARNLTPASSFDVPSQDSQRTYLELAGFDRASSNLVVTGMETDDPRSRAKFPVSRVLDLHGQAMAPWNPIKPAGWERFAWGMSDAKHNRAWGQSRSGQCEMRSVPLVGPLVDGPSFDERAAGDAPCGLRLFTDFPDENTVVGATQTSDGGWVWAVDLARGSGMKLKLPEPKAKGGTTWNDFEIHRGALSPDGQVLVIERVHTEWGPLHIERARPTELVTIRLQPLRVLSVEPLKGEGPVGALAITHGGGQVTAFFWRDDKWERLSFSGTHQDNSGADIGRRR